MSLLCLVESSLPDVRITEGEVGDSRSSDQFPLLLVLDAFRPVVVLDKVLRTGNS